MKCILIQLYKFNGEYINFPAIKTHNKIYVGVNFPLAAWNPNQRAKNTKEKNKNEIKIFHKIATN